MNIKNMLPYLESEELLILARNVLKSREIGRASCRERV